MIMANIGGVLYPQNETLHKDSIPWATYEVDPKKLAPVYPIVSPDSDPVNHPAHYNQGDIECIDAIKSMLGPEGFIAYLRGNIAKYNWRLMHKGKALSDAQKLGWYQHRLEQELKDVRKGDQTPVQG